jgi:hypothetical protein
MRRIAIAGALLAICALLWTLGTKGLSLRAPAQSGPGTPMDLTDPPADRLSAPGSDPGSPTASAAAAPRSVVRIEGRVMGAPFVDWEGCEVAEPDAATAPPLAGALVRACAAAVDMRDARFDPALRFAETRSDTLGRYVLEIEVPAEGAPVSLDAFARGHLTFASGFYCCSVDRTPLKPGDCRHVDLFLEPALYVAGVVVDAVGAPIPGVEITARNCFDDGYGYAGYTTTDALGRFEMFDVPLAEARQGTTARLDFEHRAHRITTVLDAYTLEPRDLASLRVVMERGYRIAGTLTDPRGAPVKGVVVGAEYEDYNLRKASVTDDAGRFEIVGLSAGEMELLAADVAARLWLRQPTTVRADDVGVRLSMREFPDGEPPPAVEVLGMKLADVTPALREALAIHPSYHVIILDPGPDAERIGLGWIKAGDCIMRHPSVRSFAAELVGARQHAAGIVIGYRREDFFGTNSTSLHFEDSDVPKLRAVLGD